MYAWKKIIEYRISSTYDVNKCNDVKLIKIKPKPHMYIYYT